MRGWFVGNERLEQHVPRAERVAVTTGCRMEPGLDERPTVTHGVGDVLAQCPVGDERDDGRARVVAVALLERHLYVTQ